MGLHFMTFPGENVLSEYCCKLRARKTLAFQHCFPEKRSQTV